MIKYPEGIEETEKNIYLGAHAYCKDLVKNGSTIADAIELTSKNFSFAISDINEFKKFLEREITAFVEPSIGVVNESLKDVSWWSDYRANSNLEYWERYHNYLKLKPHWSLAAVEDIDTSTDQVLNAMVNPQKGESDYRKGLVFGYVQSGKTAHYLAVINKALDAGYKIIIILTGIHNSLRSQTQQRVDEEVLGYETSVSNILGDSKERNAIGVGIGEQNKISDDALIASLTCRDEKGDFNKKSHIFGPPCFVMVNKKNASVLKYILRALGKNPCAEVDGEKKKIPSKYPALIIDDEADQASINTNESYDSNGNLLDDYNPTTINKLIRQLLDVFECKTYIAYTATPFANIFIPPHVKTEYFGEDLFPSDFIFKVPRDEQYIGAREFFGLGDDDSPVMPLYRAIISGTDFLGPGTKMDSPVGELPDELKTAIKSFMISTALRNCRGHINAPNTMLVHIVRYIDLQNKLKKRINEYLDELFNYIRCGEQNIQKELESIWINDYLTTKKDLDTHYFKKYMKDCSDVDWEEIWKEIRELARKKNIIVYSVNGKSGDAVLYKKNEGKPFNVIVIGGDKLSRGLTLEGLTISYFTRNSNTYDTLMQMCRWFGFRPGYLDACRLFTTEDLYSSFSHISMATEDLAEQFEYMNTVVQTPLDFGLRVASHPSLMITSRNKLRTGMELVRDFSCKLSQTRVFDVDGEVYDRNFEAVENLLDSIKRFRINSEEYKKTHGGRNLPANHFFWQNVPAYDVASFFESYETSNSATKSNSKYMADYVKTVSSNGIGCAAYWTICLINVENKNAQPFDISNIKGVGGGISRKRETIIYSGKSCSIKTMTSNDHEYLDYSEDELLRVREIRNEFASNSKDKFLSEVIRSKTRDFSKGLLILYPIGEAGKLTESKGEHKTPFGFAAVFPDRKGMGSLKSYRMNEIALEKDNDEFHS